MICLKKCLLCQRYDAVSVSYWCQVAIVYIIKLKILRTSFLCFSIASISFWHYHIFRRYLIVICSRTSTIVMLFTTKVSFYASISYECALCIDITSLYPNKSDIDNAQNPAEVMFCFLFYFFWRGDAVNTHYRYAKITWK